MLCDGKETVTPQQTELLVSYSVVSSNEDRVIKRMVKPCLYIFYLELRFEGDHFWFNLYVGLCKLENEILKEAKNAEKSF